LPLSGAAGIASVSGRPAFRVGHSPRGPERHARATSIREGRAGARRLAVKVGGRDHRLSPRKGQSRVLDRRVLRVRLGEASRERTTVFQNLPAPRRTGSAGMTGDPSQSHRKGSIPPAVLRLRTVPETETPEHGGGFRGETAPFTARSVSPGAGTGPLG